MEKQNAVYYINRVKPRIKTNLRIEDHEKDKANRLLVVAVLVLLVAASGVKTVLDMKNSADNEVQEEDSTRWPN